MSGRNYSNHYTSRNTGNIVHGGSEYFALLEKLIDEARISIHLQTYIFCEDETGTRIAKHLKQAAERGVSVYMVLDGYASQGLSKKFIRKLTSAGVHFRFFEPILKSKQYYFGRRLHHKIFVSDDCYGLIGGVNIADRYNDLPGEKAWLDTAFYFEGEAVPQLVHICRSFWERLKWPGVVLPYRTEKKSDELISVRMRQNDWVRGKHQIWRSYFELFCRAQDSITIMCSYFIPGRQLRKQLIRAARRGVKIKLILAGPSDVMVAKSAERYMYSWMLQNNMEIYEYQPSVLHAKLAVVDAHWVTVGSYNVNNISTYASIELNADIRNKPFAYAVQQDLDEIIRKDCIRVKANQLNVSIFKKLEQKLSYNFIQFVLNLFTFYFKKQEE